MVRLFPQNVLCIQSSASTLCFLTHIGHILTHTYYPSNSEFLRSSVAATWSWAESRREGAPKWFLDWVIWRKSRRRREPAACQLIQREEESTECFPLRLQWEICQTTHFLFCMSQNEFKLWITFIYVQLNYFMFQTTLLPMNNSNAAIFVC